LGKAAASVLLAALGVMAISASAPESFAAPREIRMVARNMTYYVEGSAEANPTLRLRAGETVRVVLRNDDRGMKHDFTVPDWDAATPLIAGTSEATVMITAPARGARVSYNCTPHEETMRGTILVE